MIGALRSLFSKGKVKLVDNTQPVQIQQVELNEGQIRSNILAVQQYGTHSAPHIESDNVCLFKGGSVDNGYVVMSFEPESTPTNLLDGDMMNYTGRNNLEDKVHRIWLKEKDGTILIETDTNVEINCKNLTAKVTGTTTLTCPVINLEGNVSISGTLSVSGIATSGSDFVSNGKSGFSHTHVGNQGSPTSSPI